MLHFKICRHFLQDSASSSPNLSRWHALLVVMEKYADTLTMVDAANSLVLVSESEIISWKIQYAPQQIHYQSPALLVCP